MKIKLFFLPVVAFFFLAACIESSDEDSPKKDAALSILALSPEQKLKLIKPFMPDDAVLSDEHPLPNTSSEKEVLLHTFDVLYKTGQLHPEYLKSYNPRLLDAKVEVPILVYTFDHDPARVGYYFTAVADNGQCLIFAHVRAEADISDKSLIGGFGGFGSSRNNEGNSYHIMTKREAVDLIKSQFPGKEFEGPIAIHINLFEILHSNSGIYWYFKIEEGEEYIISAHVFGNPYSNRGYNGIEGGVKNRAALRGYGGDPYLNAERMARLDTRLNLFEKLRENFDLCNSGYIPNSPVPQVKFTTVPLK